MTTFIPIGVEITECTDAYLMPGLNMTIPQFVVGDMFLTKLSSTDFGLFEKNQFMDELDYLFMFDLERSPVFCIFIQPSLARGSDSDDASLDVEMAAAQHANQMSSVRRMARATWLLTGDAVFDPSEHISYHRVGHRISRKPRICGRNFLDYRADRILTAVDLAVVSATYGRLKIFDQARVASQVHMAELLFSYSFRATVSDGTGINYRMLLYYACLALLLDDDFSKLRRLYAFSAELNIDVERVVAARNKVAHGEFSIAPQTLVGDLSKLARVLLCEAMALIIEDPSLVAVDASILMDGILASKEIGAERIANASAPLLAVRPASPGVAVSMQDVETWIGEDRKEMHAPAEFSAKMFLGRKS